MEKIKKIFTENGYEIYESDNLITADSKFFTCCSCEKGGGKISCQKCGKMLL